MLLGMVLGECAEETGSANLMVEELLHPNSGEQL